MKQEFLQHFTRSDACPDCGEPRRHEHRLQLLDDQRFLVVFCNSFINRTQQVPVNLEQHCLDNFEFGIRWTLKNLIEYKPNGQHYVAWKRNQNGWTVIDDSNVTTGQTLPMDIKNFTTLLFERS